MSTQIDTSTTGQLTVASGQSRLLKTIARAVAVVMLAGMASRAQQVVPANIVRVMITPTGLQLSQEKAKAGTVRLLIVNRTQMADPQLEFVRMGQGTPVSVRLPGTARQAKTWRSAILPPGSYRLSIVGIRGVEKEITVEP